jgi:hypothetical protein
MLGAAHENKIAFKRLFDTLRMIWKKPIKPYSRTSTNFGSKGDNPQLMIAPSEYVDTFDENKSTL